MKKNIEKVFIFLKKVVTYKTISIYLLLNVFFTSIGSIVLITFIDEMFFQLDWMRDVVFFLCYLMLLMNVAVLIIMKLGILSGVVEVKV